jgi:RNA polymerase subunit RPABC4/transcription elongation factor Spt4
MATLRFGETDHTPEVLEDAPKTATTASNETCPACGGTNFSLVPSEEYRGKAKVLVAHRVCQGCRHLLDLKKFSLRDGSGTNRK